MRNLAPVKAKANAHYTCQECGSTELIQAHHEIPGDDDSLVALCAECHSKRHPNLPKALFVNKGIQPYWHNKSASSLAREWGVSSRTVIRAAKKLDILPGELAAWDKELIKTHIHKVTPFPNSQTDFSKAHGVKFIIESDDLFDVTEAAKLLKIGYATVYRWIASGKVIPVRMDNRTLIPRSEVERLNREVKKKAAQGN